MSSNFLYNKLGQSYSAGAAETAFGAADEERIYDLPNLLSWFTSDPAYFDGATGTYKDKGPRGNNWQQPDATKQPAYTANWRSTGFPALQFDGSNDCIPALFNAPAGPMTLIAICDEIMADADHALIASNIGSTSSTQYFLSLYHGGVEAFCRFNGAVTGSVAGGVGTSSNKMIAIGNFDPIGGTLDAINYGSATSGVWSTYSPAYQHVNCDVTMQLGAYRVGTDSLLPGNIAEAFIFTRAMKGTVDLDTVVNAMKAKYGIS